MAPTAAPTVLYRRFRPTRFADLIGQEHVVATLTGAITSGRVSHAYLFSGPRGTGKTTTARLLARALNCTDLDGPEPCGHCESCRTITAGTSLDVTEIDAASHNGVDHIRDLRSSVALTSPGRYKVIVLDEVHMITTAAANALLKTLEEPPAHVVFVLATTEPHRVPATIRSRTQHLQFRLVDSARLRAHLAQVAAAAGLSVDDAVLDAATRAGAGSVRDALSALDAASLGGADTARDDGRALVDALGTGDHTAALVAVAAALAAGTEPRALTETAIAGLRDLFLVTQGAAALVGGPDDGSLAARAARYGPARLVAAMTELGDALVRMAAGAEPRVSLEVACVRAARAAARR